MVHSSPPVVMRDVVQKFGSTTVLHGLDLTVNPGEIVALLGPNGAGKSTAVDIILGLTKPYAGSVEVFGTTPQHAVKAGHVAAVQQDGGLLPDLTVKETVQYMASLYGKLKNVSAVLAQAGLEGNAKTLVQKCSGGQKQRVAIARALINEPRVLLLDEPLSALDAKLRANLLIELDKLHDQIGITFIFVTHDQSEALSVSDRIAIMNQGKVLQIGSPYEIYEQPATAFVAKFIGETNLFDATVVACEPHTDGFMVTLDTPALGTSVKITDYDKTEIGQPVCFTVRPEKIRISLEKPSSQTKELNVFRGEVEEPIYSGFQSKFFVKLECGAVMQVFKQHQNYLEDGPEIEWKDTVYVSWAANDGYIVEDLT